MEAIVKQVRDFVDQRWQLGKVHGIDHWDRVYDNGKRLVTADVNPLVLALFAYLHDSCREDDWEDMEHGPRAAEWIATLRHDLLKSLTDEEFEMLQTACRLHTISNKTGNPTIDACFDADRLDLWRVGITPDPMQLATERGKMIAMQTDYLELMYPSTPSNTPSTKERLKQAFKTIFNKE